MPLQFEHMFSGKGVGGRKINRQTAINNLMIAVVKVCKNGFARFQALPNQPLDKWAQCGPRNTYHADPTAARRGRHCDNNIMIVTGAVHVSPKRLPEEP